MTTNYNVMATVMSWQDNIQGGSGHNSQWHHVHNVRGHHVPNNIRNHNHGRNHGMRNHDGCGYRNTLGDQDFPTSVSASPFDAFEHFASSSSLQNLPDNKLSILIRIF
jgi:hypothetical protein